jgi:putative lipoprotein
MKYTLSLVSLALLSVTLVLGCGKQEEPAKAQKAETEQKPAVEQTASAAKSVPAQKEAEPKEHQKYGATKTEEEHGQKSDLNQAIIAYLAKTGVDPKFANPHRTAQIDLNGDGLQDALVLLENPMYFCGTGGCTMLVFKATKLGFEFVSLSTLIRSPVLVSETKTHGWRDLIVEVSGGGMAPKQVALKFTGGKYPLNPSALPALPKNQPLKGTKIF